MTGAAGAAANAARADAGAVGRRRGLHVETDPFFLEQADLVAAVLGDDAQPA